MRFALRWIAVLSALAALAATPAVSQERAALVMGNAAYEHAPKLATPVNDANDLGAALGKIGFDVTIATDLDSKTMAQRLKDFSAKLGGAKVVLFYFSGRGVQIGTTVQLAGTELRPSDDAEITQYMLALPAVLDALAGQGRDVVVLIDAPREAPSVPTGPRTTAPGLGPEADNTMIVYGTSPAGTVPESGGRNSFFAAALAKHVGAREPVEVVMSRVHDDVMEASAARQLPWVTSTLRQGVTLAAPNAETPR